MTSSPKTYFGGPDRSKHLLRDVLIEHIKVVPANGSIHWLCYYLNDPGILEALLGASQRGVQVTLTVDGRPRSPEINKTCIDQLSQSSVKLFVAKNKPLWEYFGIHWHAHLHSKLYYFSHPTPIVLIGSYNPTTGNEHINTALIEKIGDHSISHNVLVSLEDQDIVSHVLNYILNMQHARLRRLARFTSTHNSTFHSQQWSIDFLPRLSKNPISKLLSKNDSNTNIKCAISHLKGPGMLRPLKAAIKTGKKVELILESSQRRVPKKHLAFLNKNKIKYHQPTLTKNCLMHSKFILYQSDQEQCVMLGSFNWSARSWMLNHEVIACSHNKEVVSAFEQRWQEMITQT